MSERYIDWDAIRLRLAKVDETMAKGFTPDPEERRRILRARADLLARRTGTEKDGDVIEIVEFLLAGEHYAIESAYVREVHPLREYTPLPCTPKFVLGLINVRGQVVSVIDIRKFFDLPEKGITDLNQVIIIRDGRMEFGILADSIGGVREINIKDMQPTLPTLKGIREEYLRGITPERLVVLDAKKLLSDGSIVVHEEA